MFDPITLIQFLYILDAVKELGILFQNLDSCLGVPMVCNVYFTKLGHTLIPALFYILLAKKTKNKIKKAGDARLQF